MIATGDIDEGELLFRVGDNLQFLCEKDSDADQDSCERGFVRRIMDFRNSNDSEDLFAPFLNLLPSGGCHNPLCWAEPDFKLHSAGFYRHVLDETPKGMSVEELEVLSVVRSYRWGYENGYGQWLTRLIPGAHLFNHDAEKGSTAGDLFDEQGRRLGEFGAVARIDYDEGEEVYISYFEDGKPHGSATVFFLFGFLPDTVEYDTCHDILHLRRKEHGMAKKVDCISKVGEGIEGVDAEGKAGLVEMLKEEMRVARIVGDEAWEVAGGEIFRKLGINEEL
ncbi:hypothetical protein TL16_g03200 [Triparma laevis f. inornata]|uniref:SET domain-containing protein n=2 Tax=Triparma laevis TaxID=1534972 RepID=A0A9W6ZGD6_9STRA|nr:hypothetical protein TrLO_g14781 [Triparma laevis f. longispina]GMH61170.1 hypothetical protein TL16_g03200 [Triparma laevis f. inornata]